MNEFLTILFLFTPAAIANMAARLSIFLPKINFLERPVDGGRTFRGKPVLGKNKTIRGIVYATLAGTIFGVLMYLLHENWKDLQELLRIDELFADYTISSAAVFSFLVSFGAMFGDMAESFVKRQIGIQSGKPFFPFDQTDFVMGAILLSFWYRPFSPLLYIELLGLYFFGHLIIKFLGYKLKLDTAPI